MPWKFVCDLCFHEVYIYIYKYIYWLSTHVRARPFLLIFLLQASMWV